jgi:hypothetical protein
MNPSSKSADREPTEFELLLPFHVNNTLSARDARRVDDALARDPDLARQYKVIQDEYSETISLNENMGAPSSRALQKLMTAIDAEPARKPSMSFNPVRKVAGIFSGLSPRTLAWSAIAAALVFVLQAGIIGTVLKNRGPIQTASYQVQDTGSPVLLRFAPDASIGDISQLLTSYNAKIVSGPDAGMFRVRVGDKVLSKEDTAQLLTKLQSEKVVSLAIPAE